MSLIQAIDLKKAYHEALDTPVLMGASIALNKGDCIALLGASGSGKSTLLHCLGLLDRCDTGQLSFEGRDLTRLGESERARFRLSEIGFVFQFHHLIPELTAEENVSLPGSLAGRGAKAAVDAKELLGWVGLGDKLKRFPWQMSGGEQQRVALARALINRPKLLLTDEATGNLDRPRALEILDLMLKVNRELGTTILSATHDEELARRYQRQYRLKDGRIWD